MPRNDTAGVMFYLPPELHERFKARLDESGLRQKWVLQKFVEHFCDRGLAGVLPEKEHQGTEQR